MDIFVNAVVISFLIFMILSSLYLLFKKTDRIVVAVLFVLNTVSYLGLLVQVISNGVSTSIDAPYIGVFSLEHALFIYLFALHLALLILNRDKIKENPKPVYISYFVVSVFQHILLYSWFVAETGFDLAEALPLHISRVSSIIGLFYLVTKSKKIMDILFYFSFFALFSFLVPVAINGFDQVLGWSYYINHAITLTIPFLAYYATGWKPEKKKLNTAYLFFLLYLAISWVANYFTGGNYFYLNDRPLAFLNPIPESLYLAIVVVAVYAIFWIAYAAFSGFVALDKRVEDKKG